MNKTLLRVKNLSIFTDKQKIVKNIDFSIAKAQVFALVGESGSGKSLTALSIVNLLAKNLKSSGEVLYQGENLLHHQKIQNFRGSEIAFVFQDPTNCLNPIMNIGEQVEEVLSMHGNLSRKERKKRVLELFRQVDLDDTEQMYQRYPHQISGGQKQRVMIASALAGGAKLLIADEPTTALDVTTQKQVLELLVKLKKNQNLSVLLITHDLAVVKLISDRVAVMHQGEIIENRPSVEFFQSPEQDYSKALLVSLPKGKRAQDFGQTLISAQGMKVYFPIKTGLFQRISDYVRAVDEISFDLKQGQNLAIVGESGSGKTTLAKAIMRQLSMHEGQLYFQGRVIGDYAQKDYAQLVQIVFQNVTSSFNPRLRIVDTLLESIEALNPRQANLETIHDLLKQVELEPELANRYPHELSGGQLQRLSIARALSVNPKVIICDEPTSALDATIKVQILDLLLKIQKQKGLSFIIITHDISLVDYFADEVIVMKDGRVVERGASSVVLNEPKNDYTRALLSSVLV